MKLILIGPPGSGKGTQAKMLAQKLKIPHISSGDILREAVKNGNRLGKKAQAFMEKGDLVTDEIMLGIIKERITQADCQKGFIFDGFPRTLAQAQMLDIMLKEKSKEIDAVIQFKISDEKASKRLSGRLVCSQCGADFNLYSKPPQVADKCDRCGGKLNPRQDDTKTVILNRLKVYKNQTEPLINYYQEQDKLTEINADQNSEILNQELLQMIGVEVKKDKSPKAKTSASKSMGK